MRVAFVRLVAVAVSVGLQGNCFSEPGDDAAIKSAKRDAAAALSEAKRFFEQELATLLKLRDEGAVSERRVDKCRETIARIDCNQAILDNRKDGIRKSLQQIVSIRERNSGNVARMTEQSMASPNEREIAERAAAYARFRLAQFENRSAEALRELRFVVDSGDKTLKRWEKSKVNAGISEAEFDRVRANLAFYRHRLFLFEGKTEDASKSTETHVEIQAQIAERYEKLLEKRVAGYAEAYTARINLLQSRITMAVEERNLNAVREHLAARIATLEKLIKLYETDGIGQDRQRTVALKADIAWDRFLLAGATDTNKLTQLPFADPEF